MSHLDPRTDQCKLEIQKIIHLQNIANQLPNTFVDANKVTKSHITTANVLSNIDIPIQHVVINESRTRQKLGRQVSSKDKNHRKKNRVNNLIKDVDVPKEIQNLTSDRNVEEVKATENNNETSINYVMIEKR